MRLLYSNILPLATDEGQETITEAINNQMQSADRIEIAVGYVSRASLEELDLLIEENNIKNICLTWIIHGTVSELITVPWIPKLTHVAKARPIATRKNTAGMNIPTVALLDTIPPTLLLVSVFLFQC